jgi:hypothetical protein
MTYRVIRDGYAPRLVRGVEVLSLEHAAHILNAARDYLEALDAIHADETPTPLDALAVIRRKRAAEATLRSGLKMEEPLCNS